MCVSPRNKRTKDKAIFKQRQIDRKRKKKEREREREREQGCLSVGIYLISSPVTSPSKDFPGIILCQVYWADQAY